MDGWMAMLIDYGLAYPRSALRLTVYNGNIRNMSLCGRSRDDPVEHARNHSGSQVTVNNRENSPVHRES